MAEWVFAAERAYVAAATKQPFAVGDDRALLPRARAATGAIASRYLAVGTPRSFGLIIGDPAEAALSLEAHRTWFQPSDIRVAGEGADALAATLGGRAVSLAEALACDIVCVHAPIELAAGMLRKGTHVNALVPLVLPAELVADVTHEVPGLGEVAAGLVDGRQLDELTVFMLGDARIALGAVS